MVVALQLASSRCFAHANCELLSVLAAGVVERTTLHRESDVIVCESMPPLHPASSGVRLFPPVGAAPRLPLAVAVPVRNSHDAHPAPDTGPHPVTTRMDNRHQENLRQHALTEAVARVG
jgi:hypothetical protein